MIMSLVMLLAAQDAPPSIVYPDRRASAQWIDIGRVSVAVDKGISWQGVTAYLSLTGELVAVDEKSGKTLWHDRVGSFWNALTFVEYEIQYPARRPDKFWAVELSPGPGAREGADRRQRHDLKSGRKIEDATDTPAGEKLVLAGQWSGNDSNSGQPLRLLVESEEVWKTRVVKPLFEGRKDAPAFGAIDFTKHRVLVLSGDSTNCNGIGGEAWADATRILVRLEYASFQTSGPDGGAVKTRPYGIFVLPKSPATVVLETNVQSYLHGPPIWKELHRFEPALK